MAAARYWRAIGLESYAGGALELSALHLYDGGGARVDATATLSCSHVPVAGALADLQDADTSTTCKFSAAQVSAAGFFLLWDFGVGVSADVAGFRVGSASDNGQFLSQITLQSQAAKWETLSTFSRVVWPGANTLAPSVAAGDSDYEAVVLLARADGVDGATTFVDKSKYARTLTARNGAKTSTDVLLFGRPMMYFDGVNDYADCASGVDFSLPGDFDLEIWVHPASSDATQRFLFGNYTPADTGGIAIWRQNGFIGLVKAGVSGLITPGSQMAPTGQLSYVRIAKIGTTVTMTVNDVAAGSYTGALDFVASGAPRVSIGALCADSSGTTPVAGTFFHGYLAVRLSKGLARSGGVPVSSFPESASVGTLGVPFVRTRLSDALVCGSAPVPAHSSHTARVALARDVEFGGSGLIWGTTKTEVSPDVNVPTKARVSILRERDKLLAREVWSDPVTGNWEVSGLDTRQAFVALAQDADGGYRPVAADKTLPETAP